jgi:hypothetical protein
MNRGVKRDEDRKVKNLEEEKNLKGKNWERKIN